MEDMRHFMFSNKIMDLEESLKAIKSCKSLSDFSRHQQEYAWALREMAKEYVEYFDKADAESIKNQAEDQ